MPVGIGRRGWDTVFEEAALDPSKWLQVLDEFAAATGSARAELVGVAPDPAASFSWVTSVDEGTMDDFFASGGHSPQTNFRIASDDGRSVLAIVDEHDYDRVKRRLPNDDFVDFCEQYQMVHGCQTVLLRERGKLIGLSLLRTRADGRTSEEEQRVFADGALAAARAVRLQQAMEGQGHHLLAGTFEAMSTPCLLIDGFGTVRSVTGAAEQFLSAHNALHVTNGRFGARDPMLDREIGRAVRAAIRPVPARYARIAADKAVIEVFGLPPAPWSMPFAVRALAVMRSPGKLPADAVQRLMSAFGMTPAEAEVAMLLCQGVPRDQIAARRGVSAETLRSQLRSLYSKTGCSREAELVLLARTVLD